MTSTTVTFAKVKSVLSADTLILTSPNGKQERTLSLAYIQAPRLQTNEKNAFESRELLRKLLVGKQIKFWILYKTNSNREYGDISTPLFPSLIEYVLSNGAAKLRDNVKSFDDDEELEKFRNAQDEAKKSEIGVWSSSLKSIQIVEKDQLQVPSTSAIPAIVEKVLSGDRILARLLISKTCHCIVPVLIAGIKTPRSASETDAGDEFGEEAKTFVEARLLMASLEVILLGESSTGVLVGNVIHPNGNIAEPLLKSGLAEVCDWQSSLVGAKAMSALRRDEKDARVKGLNIWQKYVKNSSESSEITVDGRVTAIVARIISADTIVLRLKDNSESTVQLISLRAPRTSDHKTAPFAAAAKEYLRHRLIGKQVEAIAESTREANEHFDARPLVTIKLFDGTIVNQEVVALGFANVIRHKKGEVKPEYWDDLIEAETLAVKEKKGINGKAPEAENLVDASENAIRSKPYLFTFQNRTKINGIVEHVISANRFRITIPKEGIKLTLVLGGLANNSNKEHDFSKAGFELANKKLYQRNVIIEIYGTDKIGSFIGNLLMPGNPVPFQVALLKEGLAFVHERSVYDNKYSALLLAAEEEAKSKRLGVWNGYDPAQEAALNDINIKVEGLKITKQYLDVKITEILDGGLVAFQIINAESAKLKSFMQNLRVALAKSNNPVGSLKRNEIVAAKLIENGKFYRARIIEVFKSERKVRVQHLDYGTIETISISDICELPSSYTLSAYKAQAHIAQLSLINMPPRKQEEYYRTAISFLEDALLDLEVIACVNFTNPTPGVEYDVQLYDTEVVKSDPNVSINREMVSQGWGLVKKRDLKPFEKLLSQEHQELIALEKEAKSLHIGCWEFGDVEGDEDF